MGWLMRFLEWFPSPPKIPVMACTRREERIAAISARFAALDQQEAESFARGKAITELLSPQGSAVTIAAEDFPLHHHHRHAVLAFAKHRGYKSFFNYFEQQWEFTK